MPTLTLNAWTDVKIMPMHRLAVGWFEGATSYSFTADNLEADSSWALTPVTRPTDTGGTRVVAWRLAISATIPYNRFQTIRPWLERLAFVMDDGKDVATNLTLQPQSTQSGGASMFIGLQATTDPAIAASENIPFVQVKDWSLTWRAESSEWRPRMIIEINGLFSRDAITFGDAADPDADGYGIFTENTNWP